MNSRTSQNGSSHILAAVIILVIALLGTLGYIFWQNFLQPKTEDSPSTTSSARSEASKETASEQDTAQWKSYTSDRAGVSLKYPSDWSVTDTSKTPGQLVKIVSPVVDDMPSNSVDSLSYTITMSLEPTSGSMLASSSSAASALRKSINGEDFSEYATKKYTETINSINVTEFDMVAQSPYFAAIFPVNDYYVELDFVQAPTKADLTSTLKAILASVQKI